MGTTTKPSPAFSPAFGLDWLLPLYDPVLRVAIPEEAIKRQLVEYAQIEPGQRILDIGCGTATLSLYIKEMHPDADVIGLDPDAKALDVAREKAAAAGLTIHFDEGVATALPYPDASLDRCLSAFVFHHLTRDQKQATLREVRRVLKPGGSFAMLDFGRPPTLAGRMLAPLLHPGRNARENIRGELPRFMNAAGFTSITEAARRTLIVGSVTHWICQKA